ncbi:MAG TPA: glutathione S-transferase family protein [Candidatus Accumulibacter phosphatis]|nr:MAG: putative GST-like protein YibF [Candidatus Accumulibacter sp. SK-11]HAY26873.1 glutathione S-transferase family protein [Accumulibacter sp.]HRL78103.1 glutathione S-transferase family protein [Candidatus Accumulibacter phosphatis]HCN67749.1 glutathione S-transferase family protein [Accumulibacter sp.]HCV12435.1 glutathione S-transferase family protein [Accumulibacter sp.]
MTPTTSGGQHQLLGLYDSPFVRRVAVSMKHYGIPFEHVSLSVFRHMDAMRPLNPLFKVPMLTLPNGERLYESAYQLDYLDELAVERDISPLTPRSGADRRQVQQLTALAMLGTEKAVAIEYERKRPAERQWPDWTGRLRAQMRQAFAMLEERLDGDFLFGGGLTQADISAVAGIGFIRHVLPHEWPAGTWPALEGLAARLEASEAFRAVPIEE